jgi:ribosomal protein S6--L-glutamate ligase
MKLGFIVTRHPPSRISPIVPEVVRLLREWDVEVDLIYPEEQLTCLSAATGEEHDLYVLKSGTELALSLAGALHAAGAELLNRYPVAAACRDKVVAAGVLEGAGVPTPQTYVTGEPQMLAALLESGPLIVKPHRGSQGRGVRVVREPEDLRSLPVEMGTVFAQHHHPPDGRDRKVYCIGDQVFGVKRIWPVQTYRDKVGEPFTVSEEIRDIALRCGQAFGLELYGLDIVVSENRPYVVDVSSFPGFKGVPEAALRLADYIYAAGQRVVAGEQLPDRSAGAVVA